MRLFVPVVALVVVLAAFVLWKTNQDPAGYRDGEEPPPEDKPAEQPTDEADVVLENLVAWVNEANALDGTRGLDDAFQVVGRARLLRSNPAKELRGHVNRLLGERRDRGELIKLLGPLGEHAPLLKFLTGSSVRDAVAAAHSLTAMWPKPPGAAEALAAALGHRNGKVRKAAARALPSCGRAAAAPTLAQAKTKHKGTYALVLDALVKTGLNGAPVLRDALRSPDPRTRGTAALAAARHGVDLETAMSELFKIVESGDAIVRRHALKYFEEGAVAVVPNRADAGPAVVRALRHPDPGIRRLAARAAAHLGSACRAAEEDLLELMLDEQTQTRMDALSALAGFKSRDAVPVALALSTAQDADLRVAALRGLARIGHVDDAVRGRVAALMKDDESPVRAAAALAHWRLAGDFGPARTLLKPLLESADDGDARATAHAALVAAGPAGAPLWAVAAASARKHKEFAQLRKTLDALGPEAAEGYLALLDPAAVDELEGAAIKLAALPQLAPKVEALMESEDKHVKLAAAFVRARQGHAPAFALLDAAHADEDAELREVARRYILRAAPAARVGDVMPELDGPFADLAHATLRRLKAKEALPALRELTRDPRPEVRAHALESIAAITGDSKVLFDAVADPAPHVRAAVLTLLRDNPAAKSLRAERAADENEDALVRAAAR